MFDRIAFDPKVMAGGACIYLEKMIRDTCAVRDEASSKAEIDQLNAQVESYRSRIYQLEHWGDRVISKIQTRLAWKHDINGPQQAEGDLGGYVDTSIPWQIKYWFGGWDGDLLLGYMRGTLSVPFKIVATPKPAVE